MTIYPRTCWTTALALAALAPVMSGCGASITAFHMPDGLADLRSEREAPGEPPGSRSAAAVNVVVTSTPSIGCTFGTAPVTPGSGLPLTCFELEATDRSAARRELEAELLRRGLGKLGFVFFDLGPTTADALRAQLTPRFGHVTVTVARVAPPGAIAVRPAVTSLGPMRVSLTVSGDGRAPLTAVGESRHEWSRGHLGWAIPAVVVTFPVGLLWVPPILRTIQDKNTAVAAAEATDQAAAKLAAELAASAVR